ncbi:MAG TPA: BlaI/MecI/CopY family transcriptional regulator [Terracidiphilus sp.]|nr:BlaI/MecI/CopY family transcriptional regulator [Terracidiphilus sp.]
MKKPQDAGLTKLELRIMQAVWKLGSGTVSAVQTELETPLAYTTVQTMLNILERKGKLRRVRDGRAFVYSARVSEARALRQGVSDLVDRMFGGSNEELVMSLLKSGQMDAKKLAELTERFEREAGES